MKKLFAIIIIVLSFNSAQAQLFSGESVLNQQNFDQQRWSWGYLLGFNSYDFNFDFIDYDNSLTSKDPIVEKSVGFNVGLIGNLKLTNNLDLRLEPGVSFNTRFVRPTTTIEVDEVNSTYVHIPLLLKFSANRLNNFKPFVVGGLSTSINLSSNEDNPDAVIRLKRDTYNYEIGFGIDLYLYYFKLTPSIRGVFTINDELVEESKNNTSYLRNVDKMSSRAIFINFTFQ